MLHVVLAEIGKGLLELRVVLATGDGTHHEHLHSVAHKAAHLVERTLGQSVGPEGIVATGGQVGERGEQRAVEVEYIGVEAELRGGRQRLHAEIAAVEHMHLTRQDAHAPHRAVGAILPALQLLCALVYHHILILQGFVHGLHVNREHPTAVAYRHHLQVTVAVPFAQRRVVAQQGKGFTLEQVRLHHMEEHRAVVERKAGQELLLPVAVIVALQPEVGEEKTVLRVEGERAGMRRRLAAYHVASPVLYLITIGHRDEGALAALRSHRLCLPQVSVEGVHVHIAADDMPVAAFPCNGYT